jgi:hypothetical protein
MRPGASPRLFVYLEIALWMFLSADGDRHVGGFHRRKAVMDWTLMAGVPRLRGIVTYCYDEDA